MQTRCNPDTPLHTFSGSFPNNHFSLESSWNARSEATEANSACSAAASPRVSACSPTRLPMLAAFKYAGLRSSAFCAITGACFTRLSCGFPATQAHSATTCPSALICTPSPCFLLPDHCPKYWPSWRVSSSPNPCRRPSECTVY